MAKPELPERKRSRRETKRLYHTLVVAGAGLVFILIAILAQPFAGTNLALTDRLFTALPPSPNIVIVGIDDSTLDTYGRLADWPRSLHAQAINHLSDAEAKVIGFDVLFTDSSPEDDRLANAISGAGNVVLPAVGIEPQPDPLHNCIKRLAGPKQIVRKEEGECSLVGGLVAKTGISLIVGTGSVGWGRRPLPWAWPGCSLPSARYEPRARPAFDGTA